MKTKSLRLTVTVLLVIVVSMALVGTAFAILPNSTFNTSNGDLTDSTHHDWNPAGKPAGNLGPIQTITCPATPGAGTNCGLDLTGSKLDNSFANGPKEDDLAPSIGTGSIPPNKDDLSRFYVNQEKANGKDYLYLAWERTNLLGSAHMDFEFNQSNVLSANGVTMVRTDGDMLITFDFGGSGVPVLSLSRWLTTGSSSQCEVPSDGIPCWSALQDLTSSGFADGSVNNANVQDFNLPNAPFTQPGNVSSNGTVSSTFGEAAINLTDAGVFPANKCAHFGAADLKSRSSGQSFTSTLKDFIAPIPVDISNCGKVVIIKHTDPRGQNQSFNYTSTIPGNTSFSLNDNGNTTADSAGNTKTIQNVFAGPYTVTEGAEPSNYVLESLSCVGDGLGSTGAPDPGNPAQANLTVVADSTVTCTYTNQLLLGAIEVTKKSAKDGSLLSGAKFSVVGGSINSTITTGADGTACIDQLPFGSYTVTETGAPTGYAIDSSAGVSVSVDHNATCTSGTPNAPAAFTDSPLSRITVSFKSLAGPGVTSATIQCTDDVSASPLPEGTPRVLDNLAPGTYTCTVVVDP